VELVDTKRVEEVEVVGRGGEVDVGALILIDSIAFWIALTSMALALLGGLSFMIGFGNVDVDANVAEAVAVIQ
jgi:hypothetical protein